MDGGHDLVLQITRGARKLGSKDPKSESGESAGYDDVESEATEDMVSALGLEGEDAEKFTSAFADYVRSCVQKAMIETKKPSKKPDDTEE